MKNLTGNLVLGVALIVAAVLLTNQPVYTSVKRTVVDTGVLSAWPSPWLGA